MRFTNFALIIIIQSLYLLFLDDRDNIEADDPFSTFGVSIVSKS